MNEILIKEALLSSLSLLNDEIESIVIDELRKEYLSVIEKIENALKELNGSA